MQSGFVNYNFINSAHNSVGTAAPAFILTSTNGILLIVVLKASKRKVSIVMIKNVVFDMGGVLINFDTERYIARFVPDAEDHALIRRELFRSVEWVQMDRGVITDAEVVSAVCARLPEHLHQAVQDILDKWHQDVPPLDGIYNLVEELKRKGYCIYLLSNTSARFHSFRKNIPALRFFDGEFISADHHLIKPEPRIYQCFLEEFDLEGTECVFIDDTPLNVEGAMQCGIKGIVYHGDPGLLRRQLQELGVDADVTGSRG